MWVLWFCRNICWIFPYHLIKVFYLLKLFGRSFWFSFVVIKQTLKQIGSHWIDVNMKMQFCGCIFWIWWTKHLSRDYSKGLFKKNMVSWQGWHLVLLLVRQYYAMVFVINPVFRSLTESIEDSDLVLDVTYGILHCH